MAETCRYIWLSSIQKGLRVNILVESLETKVFHLASILKRCTIRQINSGFYKIKTFNNKKKFKIEFLRKLKDMKAHFSKVVGEKESQILYLKKRIDESSKISIPSSDLNSKIFKQIRSPSNDESNKLKFYEKKLNELLLENKELKVKHESTESNVRKFVHEISELLNSHEISTLIDSNDNTFSMNISSNVQDQILDNSDQIHKPSKLKEIKKPNYYFSIKKGN